MADWIGCRITGIRRSWVQIPLWPLADIVLGSPEFNFSATLVNTKLKIVILTLYKESQRTDVSAMLPSSGYNIKRQYYNFQFCNDQLRCT